MKKQIDELVATAKKYAELSIKLRLPDGHHNITDNDHQIKVTVYLADDGDTWAVYFDEVEIVGYTQKVRFPWHYNAEDLQGILEKAIDVFENEFSQQQSKFADKAKAEKAKRIATLEEQIERLKQELNG